MFAIDKIWIVSDKVILPVTYKNKPEKKFAPLLIKHKSKDTKPKDAKILRVTKEPIAKNFTEM